MSVINVRFKYSYKFYLYAWCIWTKIYDFYEIGMILGILYEDMKLEWLMKFEWFLYIYFLIFMKLEWFYQFLRKHPQVPHKPNMVSLGHESFFENYFWFPNISPAPSYMFLEFHFSPILNHLLTCFIFSQTSNLDFSFEIAWICLKFDKIYLIHGCPSFDVLRFETWFHNFLRLIVDIANFFEIYVGYCI